MKKYVILLIILIAGLLWFAGRFFSSSTELVADVHGRVTYADGKPVAEARVCQVVDKKIIRTVTTDDDGRFIFKRLRPVGKEFTQSSSHFVVFEKGSYLGWRLGPSWQEMLPESISSSSFDVTVHKLTTVKGSVVTDKGEPVEGAQVRFYWTEPDIEDWREAQAQRISDALIAVTGLRYTATTNEHGAFQISSMPADCRHRLLISKPGYAVLNEPDLEKLSNYRYTLTAAGKICGKLLKSSGEPAKDASVEFSGNRMQHPYGEASVNRKDGSYEIELLPGRYELSSLCSIGRNNKEKFDVKANAVLRKDFVIEDSIKWNTRISGRVVDAVSGEPVSYAVVTAWNRDPRTTNSEIGQFGITARNGMFSIPTSAGTVRLEYDWGNPFYAGGEQTVSVGPDGRSGVELRAERSAIISGLVVDEAGRRVPGAVVSGGEGAAVSDKRGRFRMAISPDLMKPGILGAMGNIKSYLTKLQDNDGTPWTTFTARDKQHDRAGFLVLERHKIRSRGMRIVVGKARTLPVIIRGPDGSLVQNALVEADATQPGLSGSSALGTYERTNAKGEVRIYPVYSGCHYKLTIEAVRYNDTEFDAGVIKSSGPLRTVEVVMKPATRVAKGIVVDRNGKPLQGAKVRPAFDYELSTLTDSRGRFTLTHIKEEAYSVEATTRDHSGSAELDGNSEVKIVLDEER